MEQVPSWWIKVLDERIEWHSRVLRFNHPYIIYLLNLRLLAKNGTRRNIS
jgi:hypothetical protein